METKPLHYKTLVLLLTLYLAQGLPSGFITQALPAILRQYQVSLVAIGWSGLILVPWGIKFLWSPLVDRYSLQQFGHSRSWIIPAQLLSIVILLIVAFFDPTTLNQSQNLIQLYALLFTLSLIGATHDIATDGLATRLLKNVKQNSLSNSNEKERHHQSQGNAVQVVGYRSGLIIGGGVLLMLLEKIGWQASFVAMAGLILLNTIPILFYREPNFIAKKRQKSADKLAIVDYIQHHYQYFWSNHVLKSWLAVLLTFKIADGVSSGMVKPMMIDLGVSLQNMGFWVTIIGSGASLLGAVVATFVLKILNRFQTLVWFNLLQALTTGLYGVVFYAFSQGYLQSFIWLYAVNALEHFFASLALIAMLTTIMYYARYQQAGSDFTLQVCLMTVLGGSVHFLGGYLAQHLGYTGHFLLSMVVGFVCLIPIFVWRKFSLSEKSYE